VTDGTKQIGEGGTGATTAAGARTNLSVNSIDEDAQANALKVTAPALYFNGSSSVVEVADDDKLTFSSSTEFGTNSSGTWSPNDNTPALTDGSGTLNQHYRVDSGAGTVTQGGSTLSVINGTATTAGQAVYYDGSVWRLKDVDDLPFSVSAWVKMEDATDFNVVSKFGSGGSTREWMATVQQNDDIRLYIQDTSGNYALIQSANPLTTYEGQWVHLAWTYAGAGPNSANAFTAAMDGVSLFVNGEAVSLDTATYSGTYTGMSNTSQAVHIGRKDTDYAKGHIRDCKIFNRSLTSTEIAQLARGNDLGFSDEWGGAFGGVYTSDFTSDSTNSFSATRTTLDAVSTVGGDTDNLKIVSDATASATHSAIRASSAPASGKGASIRGEYYIPSGQTAVDGFEVYIGGGSTALQVTTGTTDAWTAFEFEATDSRTDTSLFIYLTDGGNPTFNGVSGEYVAFRNIKVTQIGTLASFSAERYDTSTNKLYDISDNGFVGTGTSVSLTGREQPVYETGTWTPSISFGNGSTGIGYTTQEGVYTRIGNTCFITGVVTLSAVGSDTGTARLAGLPFVNHNMTATSYGSSSVVAFDMTGLTSVINLLNEDNQPNAILYDSGATGATAVTHANFTAISSLRFSMTYQIQ
jgi:hypothetical protein